MNKLTALNTFQFIEPVVPTNAMSFLCEQLEFLFRNMLGAQKPTVITCFDTSGSGKTTTVMEASKRCDACVAIISPNFTKCLRNALDSCETICSLAFKNGSLVERKQVEMIFSQRFDSVLKAIFSTIALTLEEKADASLVMRIQDVEYISPSSNNQSISETVSDCDLAFKRMNKALKGRKLVMYVDDCQLFYCGVIPSSVVQDPNNSPKRIPASEINALALRVFSQRMSSFANATNLAWVFTGTRPTLLTEITLSSGLDAIDSSELLVDFNPQHIRTILSNFFNLSGLTETQLCQFEESYCTRLSGPPKMIQFFLLAASKILYSKSASDNNTIVSFQELVDNWEKIEDGACALFDAKILSTYHGNLDATARNLAILHVTSMRDGNINGNVKVDRMSRHLIIMIEAGLLRVRKSPTGWIITPPNRFLMLIFRKYVRWYTWENVLMLKFPAELINDRRIRQKAIKELIG